jgi:predicted esterase YcpF (UPF0227 family)
MRVLYLHGYEAKPNEERIAYLVSLGFDVYGPYIDYNKRPNIIEELLEKDFDMVVGSSLGGYIGYFLSIHKEIPSILFNPPLHMDLKKLGIKIEDPKHKRFFDSRSDKWKMVNVVLGKKDTIVNHRKVKGFLDSSFTPNVNIIQVDDMSHTIKIEEFREIVDEVLKTETA